MIVSEFLDRLQDVVDDDDGHTNYPDEQRIRELDQQVRSMWRQLVDGNKEHGNFTFALQKESARKLMRNVFEWRLPSWAYSVVRVYRRSDTAGGASEPNLSLYLWTAPSDDVALQNEIPKGRQQRGPYWEWQGSSTLRLYGYTVAPELVVWCAKLPPRILVATLAQSHSPSSAVALYLPGTLQYGNVDLEEGAYINADLQVVNTNGATDLHVGSIRRCIYSNPAVIVSGARLHELTFDAAYPANLVLGDKLESVLPIMDAHCRYLVLRVAMALFQKKANKEGLAAIASDLGTEARMFSDFALSRDSNGPYWFKRRTGAPVVRDPDRMSWFGF